MDMFEKLRILTEAAKYDVACTSSGVDRRSPEGGIGSAVAYGICHSFAGDGRCISLLKILMSNACCYDCAYCVNRSTNDVVRATFSPREIADLTINFYKRNYIEGLFLSSGVLGSPNRTMELMTEAVRILRQDYGFFGYIHAKAIPGADAEAIDALAALVDRMSCNIELPSQQSLALLAPAKSKESILKPMAHIANRIAQNAFSHTKLAPAGQSTQMIIGASPETDLSILRLTQALYKRYKLKRVFFSAYTPVVSSSLLPALDSKPPLLRENRLYQADWLLRFYGFDAEEILDEAHPTFNPYLDPKCNWAVNHPEFFPVDLASAPLDRLLRVPGIGIISARRIIDIRRSCRLQEGDLRRLGVVLKRAQYFITLYGKPISGIRINHQTLASSLLSKSALERLSDSTYAQQLSMFESTVSTEEIQKAIGGQL